MGLIEFVILCLIVTVIAFLGTYALDTLLPNHPHIINYLIWGVALLIIVVQLLKATGLYGHDPAIPKLG